MSNQAGAVPGAPLTEPKKYSKRKIALLLALIALLMAVTGVTVWYMMKPAPGPTPEALAIAKAEQLARSPLFLPLEPFVVNLRDDEGDYYLRLGVVLELSDGEAMEAAKIQLPRIRNAILLLLSAKRTGDIDSLAGKEQLMQEILAEARKPMPLSEPEKGVESVYFADFVIQ
jgi:flagellar FliL protein